MLDAALARGLKFIGFDVDGVLTDNGLFIGRVGDHPAELKRFNALDGVAIWTLKRSGLRVALISGRASEATLLRARELKIDDVIQDNHKLPALEGLLARYDVTLEQCAFVGDDLADLPVLRRVGLPIAVANAVPEVQRAATFVTRTAGGHGAVREVAEMILKARGEWDELVETYVTERTHAATRSR
ncbi:MAG TPA: HAD hydrolase family protein [Gemmatimonadales bacterium]|nr:HAD hydrolase family protein [Gemmatimonadales bacterium]